MELVYGMESENLPTKFGIGAKLGSDNETPNVTCKNNSMKTNSEEKDILRNFANLNSCEDIQTQLNIWCVYTGKEKLEKIFSSTYQLNLS